MANGASLETKSLLEETPLGKTRKTFSPVSPRKQNDVNYGTFHFELCNANPLSQA